MTASEYTPSRSSSYHTASECRGASPWNESFERSSIDLDSSDPEQHSRTLLAGTSSANASFDDSEHSCRSPISFGEHTDSDNAPPIPPKNSSPLEDFYDQSQQQENKIYTIFESPTTSPSEIEDEGVKVSDDNNNLTEMTGLSYYYQNIITKQVLKTCL